MIHLSLHLENGQIVYFTTENAAKCTQAPEVTTHASFFRLFTQNRFARTLLHSEVPKYYTWNNRNETWQCRKQGQIVLEMRSSDAFGWVYTVHPILR
ncbi:hypothetical protein AVEN_148823-1 [Araneus ventricosus]|uniref:Uncharacterized protein n=1 Tax=Araneus ventricosus TaxID=182803 RepID=A0A4Y2PHI9_ARAVE|nr:hypothetical protein AVEN_148823-1 [Araneus ventricosus]